MISPLTAFHCQFIGLSVLLVLNSQSGQGSTSAGGSENQAGGSGTTSQVLLFISQILLHVFYISYLLKAPATTKKEVNEPRTIQVLPYQINCQNCGLSHWPDQPCLPYSMKYPGYESTFKKIKEDHISPK